MTTSNVAVSKSGGNNANLTFHNVRQISVFFSAYNHLEDKFTSLQVNHEDSDNGHEIGSQLVCSALGGSKYVIAKETTNPSHLHEMELEEVPGDLTNLDSLLTNL